MAFKVNYGLERAERNRIKQAKKEAKLKAKKEAVVAEATAGDQPPRPAPNAPPGAGEDV
jgi:hypothetical protein